MLVSSSCPASQAPIMKQDGNPSTTVSPPISISHSQFMGKNEGWSPEMTGVSTLGFSAVQRTSVDYASSTPLKWFMNHPFLD